MRTIAATAAVAEKKWAKKATKKCKQLPSMDTKDGDNRAMGWSSSTIDSEGGRCRRCGAGSVKTASISAGCRMNGDGYGNVVSACGEVRAATLAIVRRRLKLKYDFGDVMKRYPRRAVKDN